MYRYIEIKKKLLEYADSDDDIKAIVLIGSSARKSIPMDEFSDIDVIIATEDTERWLYGDYPSLLGSVKISFVEPTLGGAKERRILYDGALDVDMIILTPVQLEAAIKEGVASWVMNRGYEVMYDSMGYSKLLEKHISRELTHTDLSEDDFSNMVNDFFFHTVWVSKKILRGEIWSAKMCLDAYLKNYLLKITEMYSAIKHKVDVWHDGRFLDKWAEERILIELKKCFAHYDRDDIIRALFATGELYAGLARETADMKGYIYPIEAEQYAFSLLRDYFKI